MLSLPYQAIDIKPNVFPARNEYFEAQFIALKYTIVVKRH